MGYGDAQMAELQATINATDCDVVLVATPVDLRRVLEIRKPAVRANYDVEQIAGPPLEAQLAKLGASAS
jgi:predicted GTPase